ncbi:AI-2E family transporter [Furfurilactobacillus sp. WILCCON 0119]
MLEKLRHANILYWAAVATLITIFIWICSQLGFVFQPIGTFISVVFVPLIISGFLFYMLNPLVKLLMKVRLGRVHINRTGATFIVVLTLVLLIVIGVLSLIPLLSNQVGQLISNVPHIAVQSQKEITKYMGHSRFMQDSNVQHYVKGLEKSLTTWAQGFIKNLTNSLGSIVGTLTDVTITAITVPVILFYMLRDSEKFVPAVMRILPAKRETRITELLFKMSDTISQYIGGQVIECLFVGVFTSIGYMILGLPVGLLLGIVAGFCNIIPYVGPYIGITPAIIVSLILAPQKLIWVVVVVIIVQQVDGNIIYPNIIGRSLKIHPLTIIILLLAAGHLAGIPGMILCIPFYAVIRTVVQYVWSIAHLDDQQEATNDAQISNDD